MGPLEILALVKAGMAAVQAGYDLFNNVKHTMSETDQQTVLNELKAIEDATAAMRVNVDAALDEAAKK